MRELTVTERIVAVLDHLGIERVHVATQMPADIAGLIDDHAHRVGRIALIAPPRIDAGAFAQLGENLLYIAPEHGLLARTAGQALAQLPSAAVMTLAGYRAESWSDIARERADICDHLRAHIGDAVHVAALGGPEVAGEMAGIRYRAFGAGPPLVLTPLTLAASQWDPILDQLARAFRVVVLSGPHLGMLALLEQRAGLADWRVMCATIFDALALKAGDRVLDVGCGSGAIAKQFVTHTRTENPLTAVDISAYFLREADAAIAAAGIQSSITLIEASAASLPFDDDSFDAAYSITVLEECDARTALAELKRVVKRGGRVGAVVRGIDLHQWWNMDITDDIRDKIAKPAPSVGPAGVASAALYDLAREAGFMPVRMFIASIASESQHGPVLAYPETYALSQLDPDEQEAYRAAKAQALAHGTFFMTRCHHCFVGEVPR